MNTLDDLRATLGREASDLDDTDRYVRPVAVRARIRVVRRRRTAAVAAVAAIAVVAAVAGIAGLRQPDGVDPASKVAGVDVPAHVSVTGFPYELAQTATFSGASVRVDSSDADQAVSLVASGLGTGSATLYADGEAIARAHGDQDLELPVPVSTRTLRIRLDGAPSGARTGVAVYAATGGLARGVSNGTAVFRSEVAGSSLIAAAFSSPGETSVELEARSAGGVLRFVPYCTAQDDHLWVNVSIDGAGVIASGCGSTGPDAGSGSSSTSRVPAGSHRVRVYLTKGPDGPEVAPPDGVVVGVGVYQPPADGRRVMGTRIEPQVEYAGRTWTLAHVLKAPATIDTADGDRLLGSVARGSDVTLTWGGRLVHRQSTTMGSASGGMSSQSSVLLAGDRYRVSLTGGEGRLLVYRPV